MTPEQITQLLALAERFVKVHEAIAEALAKPAPLPDPHAPKIAQKPAPRVSA